MAQVCMIRITGGNGWKVAVLALMPALAGCVASTKASTRGTTTKLSERAERRYAQIAPDAVKKRAAFDFGCAKESISVTSVGAKKWGAVGCSERHLYAVNCHNRQVEDPAELQENDCQAVLIGPTTNAH